MSPAMVSDEELVQRAHGGDIHAFEMLVSRHRDRLAQAARLRLPAAVRARVSSSDVAQDCLWTARQRLADFDHRGPGSFGRWLNGILERKVKEQIRDHLGRGKRDVRREARRTTRTEAPGPLDPAPSPGSALVGKEAAARLRAALASLASEQQAILRLVHEGGLSTTQAAAQLGRSAEAGRKLYARGVASLAKALGSSRSRT